MKAITTALPVATALAGLPIASTTRATPTRTPHTSDGAHRNDSSVNSPIPISEPSRSYRYAVSGASSPKHRPTTSAGPIRVAATSRKTTGSATQAGGPVVCSPVK